MGHSEQRTLYRVAAFAAIGAVGLALLQVMIEVVGAGLAQIPVPTTVEGWFSLVHSNPVLAAAELTCLQIPLFALLVPVYLGISRALREAEATTLVATVFALVGIGVYLASNTALGIVSLGHQYEVAVSEAERNALRAAGQALLATYEGVGLDAGSGLVAVATLLLSWTMLRRGPFGRSTAVTGLAAGSIGIAYYPAALVELPRIFILEVAAPVLLLWVLLAGRVLLRLSRTGQPTP